MSWIQLMKLYMYQCKNTNACIHSMMIFVCRVVFSSACSYPIPTHTHTHTQTEVSWNISGSALMGHLPVIRCLPTLASAVGAGVTGYTRGRFCNEEDARPFIGLFSLIGHCEEVPERYLDAFSTFGSGIAFVSGSLRLAAFCGPLAAFCACIWYAVGHVTPVQMATATMYATGV